MQSFIGNQFYIGENTASSLLFKSGLFLVSTHRVNSCGEGCIWMADITSLNLSLSLPSKVVISFHLY